MCTPARRGQGRGGCLTGGGPACAAQQCTAQVRLGEKDVLQRAKREVVQLMMGLRELQEEMEDDDGYVLVTLRRRRCTAVPLCYCSCSAVLGSPSLQKFGVVVAQKGRLHVRSRRPPWTRAATPWNNGCVPNVPRRMCTM